jgi:alkylated DNA repair dioxygenase AlkB
MTIPPTGHPGWRHALQGVEAFADDLQARAVGQVLYTENDEDVGIGWHRDRPQFDIIFGLSPASACKFRLRRNVGGTSKWFTLEAQPRSLCAMSGARQVWEHSIPPSEMARYSITFRTLAAKLQPNRSPA